MNIKTIPFPKPTGKYAIGTKSFHWIDESRREKFSSDPSHPYRELMVQFWYPAACDSDAIATTPYAPDVIKFWKNKIVSTHGAIDKEQLDQLDAIFVYAKSNVILNDGIYPIVLFCPGFGCMRTHNTALCENLASHGYIVVSIDHTFLAEQVTFPNGRSIAAVEISGLSQNEKQKQQEVVDMLVADVDFVVSQLMVLNTDINDIFYHHLDLDNIGMFGHSTGGSTTVHSTKQIDRIKAGINLDGGIWGQLETLKNFNKPFMHIFAQESIEWAKMNNIKYSQDIDLIHSKHASDLFKIVIQGAGHMSFCDAIFLKDTILAPLLYLQFGIGTLPAEKITTLTGFCIIKFFDRYLKNKDIDIKRAIMSHSEMEVL